MNAMFFLSLWRPMFLRFTPSISAVPSVSSVRRKRVYKIELLPEPVLPTIPTFIPG